MQEINLSLTVEEINGILGVIGELPTKHGFHPLLVKIKQQAEAQVKQSEAPPATE